jgi:hypothetical protein
MKKLLVTLVLAACGGSIKVAPVQVQPIHVTVDVNVREQPKEPASK